MNTPIIASSSETEGALVRNTTCPYCGVGCGVRATVQDNQITQVVGDSEHPANLGRLCVKGSALADTMSAHGKLLYPQVRGQQVAWDTALDTVADEFKAVVDRYGPESVAFYLSGQLLTEDYYVANKLMKGFIGSANVDTNSRLCMSSAVAAYKRGFGSDTVPCDYQDLETCDLLVMVGSNAAWTHPVLYQRIVAAKTQRPEMRVVVVDPRTTATCDVADLTLTLAPGSDAYLFNGLLNYLIHSDGVDTGYINNYTQGFEATIALVADLTIAEVAHHTGLAEDDIQTFFDWFVTTPRTVTFYSQGVNQSSSGTDKCNAIINCHLATGRVGKTGAGPFSITGQPNAMGGREVGGLANQLAAHMDFDDQSIDRVGRFWSTDTTAANVASHPGLKAVDLFRAIESKQVRAVWIMGTNPAVSLPDANRVRDALSSCELVIVSDCVAHTDTLACADIVLPVQGWGEKDGTVTNSERTISRQRALLQAPDSVKPDWWVLSQVARRLGYGDAFGYRNARDIFVEHAQLSGFENKGTRDFDISGLAHLSDWEYDQLKPTQWPVPAGKTRAKLFSQGHFFTPSGRAQFVPVAHVAPSQRTSDQYPMLLNSGRVRDQWHTMTRTGLAAKLHTHIDAPFAQINPIDAVQLGATENDLLQLNSPTGQILVTTKITETISLGQTFVPIHWNDQNASSARVGSLFAPVTDPHSGQPESKYTPVRVRPIRVAHWASLVVGRTHKLEVSELATFSAFWVKAPLAAQGELEACGERLDFAFVDQSQVKLFIEALNAQLRQLNIDSVSLYDPSTSGKQVLAYTRHQALYLALYTRTTRAGLPESTFLADLLHASATATRWRSLAGKSAQAEDKGRLICSCFEVGELQITQAIRDGALSADALGQQLKCGTNCGSCIPELNGLIAAAKHQSTPANDKPLEAAG